MNKELIELIKSKTLKDNTQSVIENLEAMLCNNGEFDVDESMLHDALQGRGEFFLLQVRYEDFSSKQEHPLLEKKLKEALCITITFEDDGSQYTNIEEFVKYLYAHTTQEQKFCFGIKKVETLSEYPIRILFSEIYPINQLEIHLGKWIFDFIESDKSYFEQHFAYIREELSRELKIPILALDTKYDAGLDDNEVLLLDSVTKEEIVNFRVEKNEDKKALDLYLLKLYYVFIKLGSKYKH